LVIPFTLPDLLSRRLAVRTGGILTDPMLLVDGKPAPQGKDGAYAVIDEQGAPVNLRLVLRGLDVVPEVLVESYPERTVVVMPPLRWWEYAWFLVPLAVLLSVFRSPVCGLVGSFVTYLNLRVYRSIRHPVGRFVAVGLVSALSLAAYYGLAYTVLSPFRVSAGPTH
jgi:hypothetical protein